MMGWDVPKHLSKRSGHVSLNHVGTLPTWLASSDMCWPHMPCAQSQAEIPVEHSSVCLRLCLAEE